VIHRSIKQHPFWVPTAVENTFHGTIILDVQVQAFVITCDELPGTVWLLHEAPLGNLGWVMAESATGQANVKEWGPEVACVLGVCRMLHRLDKDFFYRVNTFRKLNSVDVKAIEMRPWNVYEDPL
jgi:hypothetical protein